MKSCNIGLLGLPPFTQYDAFKDHPHCSTYQLFIPFVAEEYLTVWIYHIFFLHHQLIHICLVLAILNNTALIFFV